MPHASELQSLLLAFQEFYTRPPVGGMCVVVEEVAEVIDGRYVCDWRYPGAHYRNLVGMTGVGAAQNNRVLIFTLLLSRGAPDAEADEFLKLAAQGGAILLCPEWMNRLAVRTCDTPAALWLAFLFRLVPAGVGPCGTEMGNLYGRSALAITRALAEQAKTDGEPPRREPAMRPNGPVPPKGFSYGKRLVEVPPIPCRLLEYLWSRHRALATDVESAVWGPDHDLKTDGALKSALTRANRAMDAAGCPLSVKRSGEWLIIE